MSEQSESKAVITVLTRKGWFREARVVKKTLMVSGLLHIGGATIRRDAHDGALRVEFELVSGDRPENFVIGATAVDFPEIPFNTVERIDIEWALESLAS